MRSHCFSSVPALLLTTGQVGEERNGIISISLFPIQCFCFTKMLSAFLHNLLRLSLAPSYLWCIKGMQWHSHYWERTFWLLLFPQKNTISCKNTMDTVYWKVQFLWRLLSLCVKFVKNILERVALTSEAVVSFWATESDTHFKSNHTQTFTHT